MNEVIRMGKWCPDVVRLQGAVDLRRLGLTADRAGQPTGEIRRASKFRRISYRDGISMDEISDPDVLAAFKAAIEAGLIPSGDGGI